MKTVTVSDGRKGTAQSTITLPIATVCSLVPAASLKDVNFLLSGTDSATLTICDSRDMATQRFARKPQTVKQNQNSVLWKDVTSTASQRNTVPFTTTGLSDTEIRTSSRSLRASASNAGKRIVRGQRESMRALRTDECAHDSMLPSLAFLMAQPVATSARSNF